MIKTITLNILKIAVRMLKKATVTITKEPMIMFLVLKIAICLTKALTMLTMIIIVKNRTVRTTILLKLVAKIVKIIQTVLLLLMMLLLIEVAMKLVEI